MLDFTSSNYLGFHHPSDSLRPWARLTLGVPSALRQLPGAESIGKRLARLQGLDDGYPGKSTLHLFWDLFDMLEPNRIAIYLDKGIYPIARWGVERAAAKGAVVREFEHFNPGHLGKLMRDGKTMLSPVVVTDGFCTSCGRPAPIPEYEELAERFGGFLVIDDTQSLGVLGSSPNRTRPYGIGGGGVLRWFNLRSENVISVSSLAKGFGVPMAVISGSRPFLKEFRSRSKTMVHCSQPSAAALSAAESALANNKRSGEKRRDRLLNLVVEFKKVMNSIGLRVLAGNFPVQAIQMPKSLNSRDIYDRLYRSGVMSVLINGSSGRQPRIIFLINALHRSEDIGLVGNILREFLNEQGKRRRIMEVY